MPLFSYKCPDHGVFYRILNNREKTVNCDCGKASSNVLKAGTVRVVERLDNGLMARTVERPIDTEEVNQIDAQKFDKQNHEDSES